MHVTAVASWRPGSSAPPTQVLSVKWVEAARGAGRSSTVHEGRYAPFGAESRHGCRELLEGCCSRGLLSSESCAGAVQTRSRCVRATSALHAPHPAPAPRPRLPSGGRPRAHVPRRLGAEACVSLHGERRRVVSLLGCETLTLCANVEATQRTEPALRPALPTEATSPAAPCDGGTSPAGCVRTRVRGRAAEGCAVGF